MGHLWTAQDASGLSAGAMQAERVVFSTYGDTVSVESKAKNLSKFGRTSTAAGTAFVTVGVLQDGETDETFVSTNLIDSIVSTDSGDTQSIVIEGHTIDGSGNLTFVVQSTTLNGQNEVTLGTPLARATRAYVANSGTFDSPQATLTGDVAVYDNTGVTLVAGKPNVDAAVKIMILSGDTQSQKCSTTISATDYYFITSFNAGISGAGGNASRVTFQLQIRAVFNGGVFRPLGADIVIYVDGSGLPPTDHAPYRIVPKNHDVRVVAKTDSNTAQVTAEFSGVLAEVI